SLELDQAPGRVFGFLHSLGRERSLAVIRPASGIAIPGWTMTKQNEPHGCASQYSRCATDDVTWGSTAGGGPRRPGKPRGRGRPEKEYHRAEDPDNGPKLCVATRLGA